MSCMQKCTFLFANMNSIALDKTITAQKLNKVLGQRTAILKIDYTNITSMRTHGREGVGGNRL